MYLEREFATVIKKGAKLDYSLSFNLPDTLKSVKADEVVGSVDVILNGEKVDTINILSKDTIEEASIWDYFKTITNE